ncbi:MAG TPA: MFS transporter [Dongiaceae bacterium]|jgi:PAT family beta-lactamase induction signal transducer AmpG|nr:MFS transporter [Dongiaceae bacterium]
MSNAESTVTKRRSWGEALAVYLEPRQLIILVMGFASGLPLLLTLSTLSYWLKKEGTDLTTIGLFGAAGTPYAFKFVWSPAIDQVDLPLLGRLGRRKSWLFLIQLCLAAAIFALGFTDPAANPYDTALAVVVLAFFSASQDIVIDAYRIEILTAEEQAAGAATTQVGYRIGLLLAGAGAVALSDFVSWTVVFGVLAACILAAAVFTLFVPEPQVERPVVADYRARLDEGLVQPFVEFAQRRGWIVVLLFVLLYKFGDAFGGFLANPFYIDMGFSGVEIAAFTKIYGILATVVGGVAGGAVVARIGLFRTLMIGGVLQALSNLLFSVLALKGHDLLWLGIAITGDNLAGGVAAAAFVAYLSGLCNRAFTATQYALLTSFMAQGRTLMSTPSGWLAKHLDWPEFWASTAVMAIPGLLLLVWLMRLYPDESHLTSAPAAART